MFFGYHEHSNNKVKFLLWISWSALVRQFRITNFHPSIIKSTFFLQVLPEEIRFLPSTKNMQIVLVLQFVAILPNFKVYIIVHGLKVIYRITQLGIRLFKTYIYHILVDNIATILPCDKSLNFA
jgi:hypothetical protein